MHCITIGLKAASTTNHTVYHTTCTGSSTDTIPIYAIVSLTAHARALVTAPEYSMAVALAILISFVSRRLHQYLASEATFNRPVTLHIAAVFLSSTQVGESA